MLSSAPLRITSRFRMTQTHYAHPHKRHDLVEIRRFSELIF
jgi:hypothetical protein